MLDDGILAEAIDGVVKSIALHLQISPQRVHQIIAADPFSQYMRIHRALAIVAPDRAEQMAVAFNTTHDSLLMKRELPPLDSILSSVALSQGKSLAAAVGNADVHEQLSEAFKAQRALADLIETLLRQLSKGNQTDYKRPHAVGEKS